MNLSLFLKKLVFIEEITPHQVDQSTTKEPVVRSSWTNNSERLLYNIQIQFRHATGTSVWLTISQPASPNIYQTVIWLPSQNQFLGDFRFLRGRSLIAQNAYYKGKLYFYF